MIKDVNGKFDDYSISPDTRQILLHWGYELVKNAAEYSLKNSGVLKGKAKNKCKSLSEDEKEVKRKYGKNRYKNMKENVN